MRIFVDTSAFIAILNIDDVYHLQASKVWRGLMDQEAIISSTNYILVESLAIIQNRWGMKAVAQFLQAIVPLLQIVWIDETLHQMGISAMLTANKRRLSLVDCISFEVARMLDVDAVFAYDQHYWEQGFKMANDR